MNRTEIHILPRSLGSHPISFWLRKVFEVRHVRAVFGGILASSGMVASMFMYFPETNRVEALGNFTDVNVETEKALAIPLPGMTGVSQGFFAFHGGVDITAPLGSKIYSIAAGKVEMVGIFRQGYGRHVIVEHEDGLVSLYAHMGKIEVHEGDTVTKETVLGEVGLTGHTTGPHLHLEIKIHGKSVNPVKYLN